MLQRQKRLNFLPECILQSLLSETALAYSYVFPNLLAAFTVNGQIFEHFLSQLVLSITNIVPIKNYH